MPRLSSPFVLVCLCATWIACAPSVDIPPSPELDPLLEAYANPNVNVRAEIMSEWADDIEDVYEALDRVQAIIEFDLDGTVLHANQNFLDVFGYDLEEIAGKHGSDRVALLSHGSGARHFRRLLRAYGSSIDAHPSYAQCRGPRQIAFALTYGEDVGSPDRTDMANSRCIVLIGSHIGENLHNGQVQTLTTALENGADLITVHASGGPAMLRAAADAAGDAKILAAALAAV